MSLRGSLLSWCLVPLVLVACGEEAPDDSRTASPGPDVEHVDITPYLESIFNFDPDHFAEARSLVSPGSPAARYLLHAERARVAYDAADRTGELESDRVEVGSTEDGAEACFTTSEGPDCQVFTELEFDDQGLLEHYLIDGQAWSDNVITFSEGAAWIESDASMIELTSVSKGTQGTLRLTLRHISLEDQMAPDPDAPLLHRPQGLGEATIYPDCDRTDTGETPCGVIDYVYGQADDSSDARPETVMFIYAAQPEGVEFTLDDHIGIPLTGDSSQGVAWIDLRTGNGEIEIEDSGGDREQSDD